MKKAILILISFLISYSCFSQVLVPEASTWSHKSHQQNGPVLLDNCHWQANFEEEIPLWSFEHSMGTHDWQVGDTTPDNGFEYDIDGDGVTETAPPLWVYMGRRYVSDYSGSGDRFAYIDGVSDLVTGNPEIFEASICFNSINLSEAIHPKLSFYQNYKAFNGDKTFVDFSTDNGETWTSMEVNTEVNVGAYGDNYYQMTAPVFIAGQDNVSLRFRMLTTDATLVGSGYGWQIDDVAFSELPEYDLRLVDFFIHYNDAVFNYPEYTYISSYYGAVLCTSFLSAISFSWIVKNNGYSEVTPSCFVYVYNKNDELLFYDNVQGGVLMSGCVDTIDYLNSFDISEIECFDTLKIILGSNPVAASDYSPLNNADTTMMVISNYFARDNNCINGHIGPSSFDIGHKNGEMLGNAYIISSTVWNPVSLQVFIDSLTSDSTSIRGHVFKFNINSESWDDIVQTTFYPINSTNIGEWVTLYSSEDFGQIEVGYQDMMLLVFGIEFNYGDKEDNNIIYLGTDNNVHSSKWGSYWMFKDDVAQNELITLSNWNYSGVAIRFVDSFFVGQIHYEAYICEGETYSFFNNNYSQTGVYYHEGEDVLYLHVIDAPAVVNLIGCFDEESQSLEISMDGSELSVLYKLYCNLCGTDTLLNVFYGTGLPMSLGTHYLNGDYHVLAKAEVPDCDRWMNGTVNFQVSAPALQSELDFSLYPNPAHDVLLIETSHTEFEVYITDINGKEMFHGQNTKSVNTEMLAPGSYLVHLKTREHDSVQKFIVK